MIQVIFKDLENSDLAVNVARARVADVAAKFPDLGAGRIRVTLFRENGPAQAGQDLFGVKVWLKSRRYGEVLLEKRASKLYAALAELCDALLERLNRIGDRQRVKARRQARLAQVEDLPADPERWRDSG